MRSHDADLLPTPVSILQSDRDLVALSRHEDGAGRLHGSSSSVSGGSADLDEEEMFGDMDIDESNLAMRSIPVRFDGFAGSSC